MLYPVELRGRNLVPWNGSPRRTESCHIWRRLENLFKIWGGKRESNPQPSEPQSGALPVELFPPLDLIIAICGSRGQSFHLKPKVKAGSPDSPIDKPRSSLNIRGPGIASREEEPCDAPSIPT